MLKPRALGAATTTSRACATDPSSEPLAARAACSTKRLARRLNSIAQKEGPNVRHERQPKGREAAFGLSARLEGLGVTRRASATASLLAGVECRSPIPE